jgi:hypothetical protein
VRRKGGGGEKGGEMTQTLYAHMNKRYIFKKETNERQKRRERGPIVIEFMLPHLFFITDLEGMNCFHFIDKKTKAFSSKITQ